MNLETLPVDTFQAIGSYIQSKFAGVIPVYFEAHGEDQIVDGVDNYLEVRIDGPDIDEISNGTFKVSVDVDIYIQVERSRDTFKIRHLMGQCANALNTPILVKQAGVDLGYFSTTGFHGRTAKVIVTDLGRQDKETNLLRATVATTLTLLI